MRLARSAAVQVDLTRGLLNHLELSDHVADGGEGQGEV